MNDIVATTVVDGGWGIVDIDIDIVATAVVDGGWGIVDIDIEAGRNKLISHLLYNFILTFDGGLVQPLPKRLPGVRYVHPWKYAARQENGSSWWECLWCVFR
jgi:hypothetical protein